MGDSFKRKTFLLTSHVFEPEIPSGATLVCLSRPPRNGDWIVYVPFDGDPIFRRYVEQPSGQILLESRNSRYDSYTAGKAELLSCGQLWTVVSFHKVLSREIGNPYAEAETEQGASGGLRMELSSASAPPERGKEEELLTFPEAGAILKVKRTRLYAMLRTGELRAVKIGKLWRISRKSIEEYLARSVYPGKQYRENE